MKDYRRGIAAGYLGPNKVELPSKVPIQISHRKPNVDVHVRQANCAHMPKYISSARRCANCSNKEHQKRTNWICTTCEIPLCLTKGSNCFPAYHGY